MSISDEVRTLQERLRHAKERHTRATIRAESAADAARLAREKLEQEFGIVTADDAAKLLREFQENLNATIAELQQALDEAER